MRVAIATFIGLIVVGITTIAFAQDPASATFPTLDADAIVVARGEQVQLSGTVRSEHSECYSGIEVFIKADGHDDYIAYQTIGTVSTDDDGYFTFSVAVERSTSYRADIGSVPEQCKPDTSNYKSVLARADISLTANKQKIDPGDRVRFQVTVAPECNSVEKDLHPSIQGRLFLEKVTDDGWQRVTGDWKEADECIFTFVRKPKSTNAFRVVGEGVFVGLPGYEWYWIGDTTEPILVRVTASRLSQSRARQ
jgi:hypothetical protein